MSKHKQPGGIWTAQSAHCALYRHSLCIKMSHSPQRREEAIIDVVNPCISFASLFAATGALHINICYFKSPIIPPHKQLMKLTQLNQTQVAQHISWPILSGVPTSLDIFVFDSSMLIFFLSQTASTADEKHHQWGHLVCWILHCSACHTASGYDL